MKTLIYIIGIFFLQTSCYQQEFHPESGDLIFQVGIAGGMTEAIADATGGESDLSFTHVGIITVEPAGIYVLEAKSEPGVTMTPLQKFLDSSATIEGRPAAAIARITLPERRELATRAIGEAKKYLGQPYDDSFLPHNGKMYCSELVWECYLTGSKNEHLFTARPMNFRTADGRLPQFWIDHFAANCSQTFFFNLQDRFSFKLAYRHIVFGKQIILSRILTLFEHGLILERRCCCHNYLFI